MCKQVVNCEYNSTMTRITPKKVRNIGEKALREPLMVPEHLGGHLGGGIYTQGAPPTSLSRVYPPRQALSSWKLTIANPPQAGLPFGVAPPTDE